MNAIILAVGDELACGQAVDTNSAYLARRLTSRGIRTLEHRTVGDDREAIASALSQAARRADVVLASGGLGATPDDLTRYGLADAMGSELVVNAPCLDEIRAFFRRRGRKMSPANEVQAMIPAGAEPLANRLGSAPGIAASLGKAKVFVLPGVPGEMRDMFGVQVSPRLGRGTGAAVLNVLHTCGQPESDVAARIADLMRRGANPTVGTTVADGVVSVRVTAKADSPEQAEQLAAATRAELRTRLGDLVFAEDDETMASVVGGLLRRRGQTLATAESCTGGLIGKMITDVPGASDYYLGGLVCYTNALKRDLLGIGEEALAAHGAVSEPVARAMADGCRQRLGSDWGIGVTGIAGPAGATAEKPVGLMYVCLAGPGGSSVRRHVFPGTRDIIRRRAALAALNALRMAVATSQQTPE